MTPAQLRLVELDLKKDEYKKYVEELQTTLAEVVAEVGVGGMFQDPSGTVFKLVIPEGKFVYFEKLSYNRTKRPHEDRGTLSVKEAEEAGFKVT